MFIATNALNSWYFPDEIHAYMIYLKAGVVKATYIYWVEWIGRISAIFLVMMEFHLIDSFFESPWIGLLTFRGLNHVFVMLGFYAVFRIYLPRSPRLLAVSTALLAFVFVETEIGVSVLAGTYLLDHSIYFLSAFSFIVLSALAFKFIDRGINIREEALFLFIAFAYFNAHEVNLVAGGILIAAMLFVALFRDSPPNNEALDSLGVWQADNSQQFQNYPQSLGGHLRFVFDGAKIFLGRLLISSRAAKNSRQARSLKILAVAFAIYAFSAIIQVFAPSVDFRDRVWPAKIPVFPDAFLEGLTAGLSGISRIFAIDPPFYLALFVIALFAAILFGRSNHARERGWFLFASALILGLLLVQLFVISTLDARIGYVTSATTVFPRHQDVFFGFVTAGVVLLLGFIVGEHFRTSALRRFSAPGLAGVMAASVIFVLTSNQTMRESYDFLFNGTKILIAGEEKTNDWREYRRLDKQLRATPNSDDVVYADETALFTPKTAQTTRSFFEIPKYGIANIYGFGRVVYIPCQIDDPPGNCNGVEEHPVHHSFDAQTAAELAQIWTRTQGIESIETERGLRLSETAVSGTHFVESSEFEIPGRRAIHVKLTVANYESGGVIAVGAAGDGFSGVFFFDLGTGKALHPIENGARGLTANTKKNSDGTLDLETTIIYTGDKDKFRIRIESWKDWSPVHPGDPSRTFELVGSEFYFVQS